MSSVWCMLHGGRRPGGQRCLMRFQGRAHQNHQPTCSVPAAVPLRDTTRGVGSEHTSNCLTTSPSNLPPHRAACSLKQKQKKRDVGMHLAPAQPPPPATPVRPRRSLLHRPRRRQRYVQLQEVQEVRPVLHRRAVRAFRLPQAQHLTLPWPTHATDLRYMHARREDAVSRRVPTTLSCKNREDEGKKVACCCVRCA